MNRRTSVFLNSNGEVQTSANCLNPSDRHIRRPVHMESLKNAGQPRSKDLAAVRPSGRSLYLF